MKWIDLRWTQFWSSPGGGNFYLEDPIEEPDFERRNLFVRAMFLTETALIIPVEKFMSDQRWESSHRLRQSAVSFWWDTCYFTQKVRNYKFHEFEEPGCVKICAVKGSSNCEICRNVFRLIRTAESSGFDTLTFNQVTTVFIKAGYLKLNFTQELQFPPVSLRFFCHPESHCPINAADNSPSRPFTYSPVSSCSSGAFHLLQVKSGTIETPSLWKSLTENSDARYSLKEPGPSLLIFLRVLSVQPLCRFAAGLQWREGSVHFLCNTRNSTILLGISLFSLIQKKTTTLKGFFLLLNFKVLLVSTFRFANWHQIRYSLFWKKKTTWLQQDEQTVESTPNTLQYGLIERGSWDKFSLVGRFPISVWVWKASSRMKPWKDKALHKLLTRHYWGLLCIASRSLKGMFLLYDAESDVESFVRGVNATLEKRICRQIRIGHCLERCLLLVGISKNSGHISQCKDDFRVDGTLRLRLDKMQAFCWSAPLRWMCSQEKSFSSSSTSKPALLPDGICLFHEKQDPFKEERLYYGNTIDCFLFLWSSNNWVKGKMLASGLPRVSIITATSITRVWRPGDSTASLVQHRSLVVQTFAKTQLYHEKIGFRKRKTPIKGWHRRSTTNILRFQCTQVWSSDHSWAWFSETECRV